jgi:hypothetical protein
MTRSGSTVRGFLNGTQELSFSSAANISLPCALALGSYVAGTSSANGYLDDVRITKGYARYTSAFTPPTAPFPTR